MPKGNCRFSQLTRPMGSRQGAAARRSGEIFLDARRLARCAGGGAGEAADCRRARLDGSQSYACGQAVGHFAGGTVEQDEAVCAAVN